jgi:hypothetical protein
MTFVGCRVSKERNKQKENERKNHEPFGVMIHPLHDLETSYDHPLHPRSRFGLLHSISFQVDNLIVVGRVYFRGAGFLLDLRLKSQGQSGSWNFWLDEHGDDDGGGSLSR